MNPDSTTDDGGISEEALRSALALSAFDGRAAQRRMEPVTRGPRPARAATETPRQAAALAYLFPRDGHLHLPITLRRKSLREHSGQVSLPGGRPEAGEDLWQTALREAWEEIALARDGIEPVGVLEPVYIPVTHTRMLVHVALGSPPRRLVPNPDEVVRIEVVPVAHLLDPDRRRRTQRTIAGREIDIPYFDLGGLEVWGATAMALSELAERLRSVL